jgi:hypothetical protein
MAECKPSSKSWAFNTKIKKTSIIDGFYLKNQKPGNLINEETFPEDIDLLKQVEDSIITDPKIQGGGKFDKPSTENFSETVTTEYTLTYRNTYNICTEDGKCEDWYLGPEATIAAGDNDLSSLSRLFGKKITGITSKGYLLDKRSEEAEKNANISHEKKCQNVIDSLVSNEYRNKFIDTYQIHTISYVYVPGMFYISAGINRNWTYDSIDLPVFGGNADNTVGTGGLLSPSFNYNVQKSKTFLGVDWENYNARDSKGNLRYPGSDYYFKKIPGVPDPNNRYRMVPPDSYRKNAGGGYVFKSYGYQGSPDPKDNIPDGVTQFTVNQWDTGITRFFSDEYGQGRTDILEPIGPYGTPLALCVTTDEYGNKEEFFSPFTCGLTFEGSSRIYYGDSREYIYINGTWKIYSFGTTNTYEKLEDKIINQLERSDTTECENNYDPVPVKGKGYQGGTGQSCKCN